MARKFKNIQKVIEKKIFLLTFLVFSIFAIPAQESENLKISDSEENLASSENPSVSIRENLRPSALNVPANFQDIFFESAKYAITGISENYEAMELAKINFKNLKSFYSAKIATFDEKHHLIPLYIAEKLAPNHLGEIDSLYDSDDLVSYVETFVEDENAKNFSGDWIDQAIALSEMQNTAPKSQVNDGQSLLDYLEKGDSRGIAEQDEKKIYENEDSSEDEDEEENERKKEFTYADKSGVLRRFYYDGEGMSVNFHGEDIYITRTYGNEILRKCFDSAYRLVSEEKLTFDANPKNVTLVDLKTYTYNSDSVIPSSMKDEQKDKDIVVETEYNEKGLPKQVKTGHWQEDEMSSKKYGNSEQRAVVSGQNLESAEEKQSNKIRNNEDNNNFFDEIDKSKNDEKSLQNDENKSDDISQNQDAESKQEEKPKTQRNFYNDKFEMYLYDDENRITEYELTTWSYRKNLFGRLITESLKTKYEYSYHDEKKVSGSETQIPPNYKFYENDVLRMERNYTASDDFTEKMYFSDEFYVETSYVDGVKKLEVIYSNGKETRRREF